MPYQYPDPLDPEFSDELDDYLRRQRMRAFPGAYEHRGPPVYSLDSTVDALGGLPDWALPPDQEWTEPSSNHAGLEPAPISETKTYRVGDRDTLAPIAQGYYGADWKAGMAAMMLANDIPLNSRGSPLIRPGQTLTVPELSGDLGQLHDLGVQILKQNDAGLAAARTAAASAHVSAAPARLAGPSASMLHQLTEPLIAVRDNVVDWMDHGPLAGVINSLPSRALGRWAGVTAGLPVGAAKEVVDIGKGIGRGVGVLAQATQFGQRLLDPLDALKNPAGQSAWEQLGEGTENAAHRAHQFLQNAAQYQRNAASHPETVRRDIRRVEDRMGEGVNHFVETHFPTAPLAPTLSAEFGNSERIGENDGRLGAEVLSVVAPVGWARGFEVPGLIGAVARRIAPEAVEAMTAARLQRRLQLTPEQAKDWAKLYDGMGDHAFITRAEGKARGLPKSVVDSPHNVLKPKGMSKGDFFMRHYGVDDSYFGGAFRRNVGGGGWSGRDLGFRRYSLPERMWLRTPTLVKGEIGLGLDGLRFADEVANSE